MGFDILGRFPYRTLAKSLDDPALEPREKPAQDQAPKTAGPRR